MIDQFSSAHEGLMVKLMPKFARIESARASRVWDMGSMEYDPKSNCQNGGRKAKPISEQTYNEAVERYKSGQKPSRIIRELQISKYALSRILAAEGLKAYPERELPQRARIIRDMLKEGMTTQKIADSMGITRQAVSDWIKRYGIGKL